MPFGMDLECDALKLQLMRESGNFFIVEEYLSGTKALQRDSFSCIFGRFIYERAAVALRLISIFRIRVINIHRRTL